MADHAVASVPRVRLVLLRHGESEWNAKDLFTGWANPGLTASGERDAVHAGHLLAAHNVLPAAVHTSLQRRAIRTAELTLAACDRDWIGVHRSWRLNGRRYGALQGRDKAQVLAEYGEEQLMRWRRSYGERPPSLAAGAEHSQFGDPRYASLPTEARPRAESLRDVTARLLPYWYDVLVPQLRTATTVLVVSHGNTLRALIKHLDGIADDAITTLEVPHAVPVLYYLDGRMRPLSAVAAISGWVLRQQLPEPRDEVERLTVFTLPDVTAEDQPGGTGLH
jgi:2,3-bisphosphoglycerate-dependent phosphoglycerate mutase